ncbi:MAG TPA: tetratricopeptide repeat protein [Spirochaetota bacterium]|nr:tetratricopeptide repeat protein [Spirochaetota bacterium]
MGDSEEKIEYTPEELEEIEKVLDVLPEHNIFQDMAAGPVQTGQGGDVMPLEGETVYKPEPDFDDLFEDASGAEDMGPEDVVDVTDIIEEFEDEPEMPAAGEDEIPDIGDIADFDEIAAEPGEREAVPELSDVEIDEIADFPDEAPAGEISLDEFDDRGTPEKAAPFDEGDALSTLDELDELSAGESGEAGAGEDTFEGFDDVPEIDESLMEGDLSGSAFDEAPAGGAGSVSFDTGIDADVPDLSDISLEEVADIPEADISEIPDIDIGGLEDSGGGDFQDTDREISLDDDMTSSVEGIEDFSDVQMEEPLDITMPEESSAGAMLSEYEDDGLGALGGLEKVDEVVRTEEIPEIEEDFEEPIPGGPGPDADDEGEGGIELSDRELKKLKTAIMLFHPNLRKQITDTILNDRLSLKDTRQLIDLIITGKPEENIHRFLEKKLGRTIDISEEVQEPGRKVLTSRPEYTRVGMERQKKLLKLTKIFGAAALGAFLVTILSYQYIYKPVMAKKKIQEGVALIRRPGLPTYQKRRDYEQAEILFQRVHRDYIENYIPGYNAYARAYFDVKEYDYSYQKLKSAFKFEPGNIETLNNFGYFYSRIPGKYYERHGTELMPPDPNAKKTVVEPPLNVAIRFYKYALNKDPKNVTALYGIGNAYMFQGRFFEARQYFENILRVDRDSIVGYSGLLNLFIVRDDFVEVVTTHTDLKERDMLEDLDSALLAKLAWYYMGKKRTDNENVRVDYSLQSRKYVDISDNPYPVAQSVLNVLTRKDPDYPPLYVHKARFARDQGNYKLMHEYIKMGLDKEPNYYAAQHLMGVYHYLVKEPVDAYSSFRTALKAYQSPPDFVFNDFYQETETIGNTYAMMGNIFYYYFDKVRSRYKNADELEDSVVDDDRERRANNGIAQEYYEKAEEAGEKSPELFYNLGRLYYLKGLYTKSLEKWLNLYDDFISKPELMFALGNAFYHLNNLESSKGEYLRLISLYERDAEDVAMPTEAKVKHLKLFETLSAAYNNLGAVYQLQGNSVKSNLCFWRSIEFAKRINRENEYARVNLNRSFKSDRDDLVPLLDEELPFGLDVYREELR